jgi:feruloyl-CoA synthase
MFSPTPSREHERHGDTHPMTAPKFRPLTFGVTRVVVRDGAPGVRYLKAEQALKEHPARLTDRLKHWADTAPERTFMAVDAAMQATGPDTIAKFLFTSGSTKLPKAVINTHRMWCANQQQMRQCMPVLAEEPPVLVDWLPWNHTFGGNHNFGMVLYNGGTLYIDDGKPTPALHRRDPAQPARDRAHGVLQRAHRLRGHRHGHEDRRRAARNLLSRVRMFFYAGAALAQPVWDSLYESEEREIGERIVHEHRPGHDRVRPLRPVRHQPQRQGGRPRRAAPGLEIKLVDLQGKSEVRYRGPNITPGYWRAPAETAEHFDDEGFFCSGDAVKWIDEDNLHLGLKFDGRIAEDFKLATGTFVSVGPLRARSSRPARPTSRTW